MGGRNFYPQDIEEVAEGANSNIRPGCVIVFELEVDDQESIVILAEIREPKKIKDSEFERIADDVSSFGSFLFLFKVYIFIFKMYFDYC